jgi:threonylcarbamoyladenosine tRNA methylthiotransferase MtaB
MNVYLETLGCRLNDAEVQSWGRELRSLGHRVVGDPSTAHVMILNTCAVTTDATRTSRRRARRLRRRNPTAGLVVTGCQATLDRPLRAGDPQGDLVVANRDKPSLVPLVLGHVREIDPRGAGVADAAASVSVAPNQAAPSTIERRTRAFIKVQDGCRHRCTYCVVTIARGDEWSRPIADIVSEIRDVEALGVREIVLTGVHLGGFGHDRGTTLHALVEAILRGTRVPRVRLSSLEPWDLAGEFWSLWKEARLMPHVHLPLQSGCDRTLRRMGRRCDTRAYATLVARARAEVPALSVTTDLIVGFPGETEDEWQETLRTVRSLGFSDVHVFPYSVRSGTGAARLPDPVPPDEIRRRCAELSIVVSAARLAHLDSFIGQTRNVLWELPRDRAGSVECSGYTDNYLRVVARRSEAIVPRNTIVPTELIERRGGVLIGRPALSP